MTRRVTVLLAVFMATNLFVGCGGQDTPVEEEEAASDAPVESLPSYDPGPDTDSEICLVEKVIADLGPEGAQRLTDELLARVQAGEFVNMQEAYAAQGYICDGAAK